MRGEARRADLARPPGATKPAKLRTAPNIPLAGPNSHKETPAGAGVTVGRWDSACVEWSLTMIGHNRMSPLTALFIGMFGVGAVGIASGAGVVLYAMRIIDTKASAIVGIAADTVQGLPDLHQLGCVALSFLESTDVGRQGAELEQRPEPIIESDLQWRRLRIGSEQFS